MLNGYSDWYLPSKDELNILYINKNNIGGFNNDVTYPYWSSSEYIYSIGGGGGYVSQNAFCQYFSSGFQNAGGKWIWGYVRPIRSF